MDFIVPLVLAVLAFPIFAIVALVTAVGARNQARALEQRVIALEHARGQTPSVAPTAARTSWVWVTQEALFLKYKNER